MVRSTAKLRESIMEESRRSSARKLSLQNAFNDLNELDDLDEVDDALADESILNENAMPVTSTPLKKTTQFNAIQVAHLEPIVDDDSKENLTVKGFKTPVQLSPARHKPLIDITLKPDRYTDVDAAAEAIKKVSLQSPIKMREALLEQKPPEKRLTIHKLVLENFKSYAGRQELGPFHSVCVTAYAPLVYYSY